MPARPVPRGGPAKTQHRETLSRDMLCQRERTIGINGRLISPRLCRNNVGVDVRWPRDRMVVWCPSTSRIQKIQDKSVSRMWYGYQVTRQTFKCHDPADSGVTLRAFAQAQSRVGSLRQHSASSYHNFPKVASTHHLEMAQNPQAGREEDVGERIMQEPVQLSKLPEIPVHVCGTAAWTA